MERINVPLDIKASGNKGQFEGYGSVFGNKDLDGDIIVPGAFEKIRKTRKGKLRVALYHDLRKIAGLADVHQKEDGLHISGQLNMNLSYAPDAYELMKDGSLDGMSVGFNILPGGSKWEKDDNDDLVRVISKAELWEVSVVPFGANPEALIESVKTADGIEDIKTFELFLRKHGFSRREAVAIASTGFKGFQRDAGSHSSLSDSGSPSSETLADLKSCIATHLHI